MRADAADWPWPLVLSGTAVTFTIWFGGAYVGHSFGLLAPLGLLGLGFGGYAMWQVALRKPWALIGLLALVQPLLAASFRTRSVGEVGLDPQNAMKPLFWCVMLGVAILNIKRLKPFAQDPVLLCFGLYCLIALMSASYSYVPVVTVTGTIGIIAYLLFACLLAATLPEQKIYRVVLWSLSVFLLVNIVSAILLPDVAFVKVESGAIRFQGISGHPNQLSRISAVYIILVLGAAYRGYVRRIHWISLAAMAAGIILLTQSRTALLALILAGLMLLPRRLLLPLMVVVGVVGGAILLSGESAAILGLIGRGGDVQEAESMSGRTDLWEFAWSLIREQPILGFGYNSFEAYGWTRWTGDPYAQVVATHNNYLSILYNTGIVGAVPLAFAFLLLMYRRVTSPDLPRDFTAFSVLFFGFSEADVPTIAIVPSFMFFLILALDAKRRLSGLDTFSSTVNAIAS